MDKDQLLQIVSKNKGGQFLNVIVDRPAEVLQRVADEAGIIRKRSAYRLQLASYANRQPVKQAVEAGERSAPETPAWVARTETMENGLKLWYHANGQAYLALPVFGDKSKAIVQWKRNGRKVKKESIEKYLTAKEKRETPPPADGQVAFNAIKLENIAAIAGKKSKENKSPAKMPLAKNAGKKPRAKKGTIISSAADLENFVRRHGMAGGFAGLGLQAKLRGRAPLWDDEWGGDYDIPND